MAWRCALESADSTGSSSLLLWKWQYTFRVCEVWGNFLTDLSPQGVCSWRQSSESSSFSFTMWLHNYVTFSTQPSSTAIFHAFSFIMFSTHTVLLLCFNSLCLEDHELFMFLLTTIHFCLFYAKLCKSWKFRVDIVSKCDLWFLYALLTLIRCSFIAVTDLLL
jgi:hypothetical protein